jgi:hypothetical protein
MRNSDVYVRATTAALPGTGTPAPARERRSTRIAGLKRSAAAEEWHGGALDNSDIEEAEMAVVEARPRRRQNSG